MTAEEEARRDVEAWLQLYPWAGHQYEGVRERAKADLVARLTPVYKRAQQGDDWKAEAIECARRDVEAWLAEGAGFAIRERVWVGSQAKEALIARLTPVYKRAQEAEADVARLRAAAQAIVDHDCDHPHPGETLCAACFDQQLKLEDALRAALAETAPKAKPNPPKGAGEQ